MYKVRKNLQNNLNCFQKLLDIRKLFLFFIFFILNLFLFFFSIPHFDLLFLYFVFNLSYYVYLQSSWKKVFSIFFLSSIIFCINLFQSGEGSVLFSIFEIPVTSSCVVESLKKAFLVINLFFLSSNCIFQNRNFLLRQNFVKNKLFINSLNCFFYLVENIKIDSSFFRRFEFAFYRMLSGRVENNFSGEKIHLSFFLFHLFLFLAYFSFYYLKRFFSF